MKKTLLLATVALAGAVSAQALEPRVVENVAVYTLSSDGNWAAGENLYFSQIMNLNIVTDEMNVQSNKADDEYLGIGAGNCISNYGTMLYNRTYACEKGYYLQGGEQFVLPMPDDYVCCLPNGITPDGRYIVGLGGYNMYNADENFDDSEEHRVFPLLWKRQTDGTYAMPLVLDYPDKDLFGRMPMSVHPNFISDDATLIAGQLVDATGQYIQILVWRLGDDGNWTCSLLAPELYAPEGVKVPGPEPVMPQYPDPKNYMTPEQLAAYQEAYDLADSRHYPEKPDFISPEGYEAWQAALAAYYEDYENNPYPDIDDFMTAEELAAYDAAMQEYEAHPYPDAEDYMSADELAAYQQAVADYEASADEASEAYWNWYENEMLPYLEAIPGFSMNGFQLSGNGRYLAASNIKQVDNEDVLDIYLFDLQSGDYKIKKFNVDGSQVNIFNTGVTNEGTVVAAEQTARGVRTPARALIAEGYDGEFQLLQDYMEAKYPAIFSWMKENMQRDFTYTDFDWETEEDVTVELKDAWFIGQPRINSDQSVIATWADNTWEEIADDTPLLYSYVMPLDNFVGLETIDADASNSLAVSMDRHGVITVKGDASALNVYDLNGRLMLNVEKPGATVATGLVNGSYIIKAEGNNTRAIVKAVL